MRSVALIQLRLEVADTCDEAPVLDYEAEEYLKFTEENESIIPEENDLSFTLQSEPVEIPKTFKEDPAVHQGKREFREFTIETYYPTVMETDEIFTDKKINEENGATSEHYQQPQGHNDEQPSIISPRGTRSLSESTATREHRLSESSVMREHRLSESGETREHRISESSDGGLVKTPNTIQFFSGNPSVEVTWGVMHIYKDKFILPFDSNSPRSNMLCILGVPAKCSCQDLQRYIAPARDTIHHIKIIRDSVPNNQYMVLLRFRDQVSADIFYQEYEGKPFNSLECEVSHIVYVSKVEAIKSANGGYLPVTNLTELPTCPVCLERMDESVAGILTVLCNHSFHNDCLMKWQDLCCPVCRYCLTPEPTVEQTCFECDSRESLWICVICGHIGCGRYQEQHAYQHYQQTAHTFSMHLGNQRVWDYAGDNYVHRLIQSKGDGKVVSMDNREEVDNEKMDSLTLEYTYLLTNQLESQRLYFEEKIDFIESDAYEKLVLMQESLHKKSLFCDELEGKLVDAEKERKPLEKKYENVVVKATTLAKELRDEKQMNECLRENQAMWQEKVSQLDAQYKDLQTRRSMEVQELQSEITDLMKHLEVQCAVGNAEQEVKDDIQGGQVFVEQTTPTGGGARPRPKNRKR